MNKIHTNCQIGPTVLEKNNHTRYLVRKQSYGLPVKQEI